MMEVAALLVCCLAAVRAPSAAAWTSVEPHCVGHTDCLQGAEGASSAPSDAHVRALDDDPVHDKQVLHESAARMTEDLRRDGDEEDDAELVEEGRSRSGRRRTNKLAKKIDGSLIVAFLLLKTMPLVFIATKVAVLSFLVQLKTLVLTLVSTAIAGVQFFWKVQEKRHSAHSMAGHGMGASGGSSGWEEPSHWPDRRKYISI